MNKNIPETIVIGEIKRDYIITDEKRALNNRLGGSSVSIASGLGLWGTKSIILSAIDQAFPEDLFLEIQNENISFNGVRKSSHAIEHRQFNFFKTATQVIHNDPAKYYLKENLSFPKELLGIKQNISKEPFSLYPLIEIPEFVNSSSISVIAPLSYDDHIRIPFILREKGVPTIILRPHPTYMKQVRLNKIPQLISNLTAFIPTIDDLVALYPLLRFDPWMIVSQFENQGCKFIIVPNLQGKTLLYDLETKKKYSIPAYPVRIKNLLNIEEVFSGGFAAGFQKTLDPLEATLYGLISASFAMNGYTATYALDTLPSLAEARINILREEIKRI